MSRGLGKIEKVIIQVLEKDKEKWFSIGILADEIFGKNEDRGYDSPELKTIRRASLSLWRKRLIDRDTLKFLSEVCFRSLLFKRHTHERILIKLI